MKTAVDRRRPMGGWGAPMISRKREMSPLLDEIAQKLLRELQKDARLSYAELGRRVGLSPSATAERMRQLGEAGVIRGSPADIDPDYLAFRIQTINPISIDSRQKTR